MTATDDVDLELVRMHLVQAHTRAVDPDTIAHLHAALEALKVDVPTGLEECPTCHRLMLPERLDDHDCRPP